MHARHRGAHESGNNVCSSSSSPARAGRDTKTTYDVRFKNTQYPVGKSVTTLADALLVEAKRRPGPRPRAEGHQRGAGDDWVCVDLDRVVVQLLSEEARERLGLEDLHTGAWDPQLDDIEDVPWRNYVEGEPLPPDR